MEIFNNLRDANKARDKHWDPEGKITADFRMVELAGEVGEVCNLIKKLWREAKGLPGSRATVSHLAEELADVIICVDLALMAADSAPAQVRRTHLENPKDIDEVMNISRMIVSDLGRFVDSADAHGAGGWIMDSIYYLAAAFDINIDKALADKFNATSDKVGLPVRLQFG